MSLQRSINGKIKKVNFKAHPGRGRKQSQFVQFIYPLLFDQFRLFVHMGVQIDPNNLSEEAIRILAASEDPAFTPDTIYEGKTLVSRIKPRWITVSDFMINIIFFFEIDYMCCFLSFLSTFLIVFSFQTPNNSHSWHISISSDENTAGNTSNLHKNK